MAARRKKKYKHLDRIYHENVDAVETPTGRRVSRKAIIAKNRLIAYVDEDELSRRMNDPDAFI